MIDFSTYDEDIFYHQTQKRLNDILSGEERMYHYTSVSALQQIIQNKCLFATHINFLNDWQEYAVGYEKLTAAIKKAISENAASLNNLQDTNKKYLFDILYDRCLDMTSYYVMNEMHGNMEYRECMMPEVFTVSFCAQGDLLNQWSMYAKESGVAIEFNFKNFVMCDASLKNEKDYGKEDWQQIKYFRYNRPHRVSYDAQRMQKTIEDEINEVIRELANSGFMDRYPTARPKSYLIQEIAKLYSLAPFFKVDNFKGEDEIRLAFMRLNKVIAVKDGEYGEFQTELFYREANHVLKPYIKIGWEPKAVEFQNTYPIKRIIVGPGSNQDAVFRGIIHFLENQGKDIIPCEDGRRHFSEPLVNNIYKTGNGIYIQKSGVPFIF